MKLKSENLSIETNEKGEISSIVFLDKERLHDGKQWWPKTFPMIWPVIGFSNGFEVGGVNHKIPKHGFWKELSWEQVFENNSIVMLTTHMGNDVYPFTIDINNKITLDNNKLLIETTFYNLSKQTAYFHFGHHGAFVINQDAYLDTDSTPWEIDLKGLPHKNNLKIDKINKMKFGIDFDTLVFKDIKDKVLTLITNDLRLGVVYGDFEAIQVWKPKDAMFVCLEPWIGQGDFEYDAPIAAKDKRGIIELKSGNSVTKKVIYTFDKLNVA